MEVRVDFTDINDVLQLTVKYLFVATYNPNVMISYDNHKVNFKIL